MYATGGGKTRRVTHAYSHSPFLRCARRHNYSGWSFVSRGAAAGRVVFLFALRQLYFLTKRKWLALILFGIVVAGIAAAAVYFTRTAILALPDVADTSIPSASAWAQKRQIELPF